MVVWWYLESEYFFILISDFMKVTILTIETFVLVLSRVGRNVAAGMTGGLAYILDEDDTLIPKVCVKFVNIQV